MQTVFLLQENDNEITTFCILPCLIYEECFHLDLCPILFSLSRNSFLESDTVGLF